VLTAEDVNEDTRAITRTGNNELRGIIFVDGVVLVVHIGGFIGYLFIADKNVNYRLINVCLN